VCGLARLSRPYFEHPPEGVAEHPLLSSRGLVWVGEAGDVDLLDQLAERATLVAPTARRLDAASTHELLPTFAHRAIAGGAVHEPDAMSIDTAAVIDGYLRTMRRHSGRLVTDARVVTIERLAGGAWFVGATTGEFRARHIVDAAGAWADEVAVRAGLDPIGLVAMRRTAAITPAPDVVVDWPLVMDVAGRYYCEPEPGGLLISPADETPMAPCDVQPDELDVALALERVRDATGLPLRAVRRAWAGLRTFAPDRVPVLGEDPVAPGFWWLAGQGGAGIKTAPAMAQLLVRCLAGIEFPDEARRLGVTADALSPARFR
jgi:D-arginine dehydrogenase